MSGDEKNTAVVVDHQHNQYATFQGVANYPPPPPTQHHGPAIGFPQPVSPPGPQPSSAPPPQYYSPGPGYAVAEGTPAREHRLPCCGCGFGWFLFIIGFFLGAIPWYIGLFMLLCVRKRMDHREKPGYVACTIAAVLATIIIIISVTQGIDD
ncbi:hypothetical protein like AT1G17080 [Hibiscus trionum]|uniref:60S ribosomal protein L18a-like protein n=1 Tax=Hibiscus trionum TaxID=183268 RepID=A0A9W7JB89_HIBTR|nr:hypothetical protein like AT1G17080 [Hibiscus trionum]